MNPRGKSRNMWLLRQRPARRLRVSPGTRRRRLLGWSLFLLQVAAVAMSAAMLRSGWQVWVLSATAVATLMAVEGRGYIRQRATDDQLADRFWRWTTSGGPLVSEIEDPLALGVHPAPDMQEQDEVAVLGMRSLPPYVMRSIDGQLDNALRKYQFVLLVGDATAGKSRSAFEAMCRVFPRRLLIVTNGKTNFLFLRELGLELPDSVVWLDELDTFIGDDGLTLPNLERLLSSAHGRVTVLATMRAAEHAKYRADRELTRSARQILDHVHIVRIRRKFASLSDSVRPQTITIRGSLRRWAISIAMVSPST